MNQFLSLYKRTMVFLAALLLAASMHATTISARADIAVKTGQKVAFLGDSITANGWNHPAGYVRLECV